MGRLKKALKLSGILVDEVVVALFLLIILPSIGVKVPLKISLTIIAILILKDALFVPFLWRVLEKRVEVGGEALIGAEGIVVEELDPEGIVRIGREYWRAIIREGRAEVGEKVRVVGLNDLKLIVKK